MARGKKNNLNQPASLITPSKGASFGGFKKQRFAAPEAAPVWPPSTTANKIQGKSDEQMGKLSNLIESN